jgi:hypothetical protein
MAGWTAEDFPSQEACELILQPITNGDISYDQLSNPILSTQAEIDEQVDMYTSMYQCLAEGTAAQIDDQ